MQRVRYMISDASKLLDVEAHVLRYWEEETGLIVPRNEMGHRYYTDDEIAGFKYIKKLKDNGFSLKSIRILMPDMKRVELLDDEKLLELRNRLEDMLTYAVADDTNNKKQLSDEPNDKKNIYNILLGGLEQETVDEKNLNEEVINNEILDKEDIINGVKDEIKTVSYEENLDKEYSKGERLSERKAVSENEEYGNITDISMFVQKNTIEVNNKKNVEITSVSSENAGVRFIEVQNMLNNLMTDVVRANNEKLVKEINTVVSGSVREEINYAMKLKEERDEERFRMFDKKMRDYQAARQESAVAKNYAEKKKKSRFFEKYKRKV